MTRRRITLCIVVVTLAGTVPTQANQRSEDVFPRQIRVKTEPADANAPAEQIALVRNGVGLCEWGLFRVDLYRAALYLEDVCRDPNRIIRSEQAKRLHLVFSRSLSRRQSERAFVASFRANAGDELPRYQKRLDQLCSMMRDVRKGDSLVFTYVPGRGLESHFRGRSLGVIRGDDFARMFFTLYVGPIPPTPALRKGLLGLSDEP